MSRLISEKHDFLHYGPKWSWDQTRPEAILAHQQMEEFHKGLQKLRRRRQAKKEVEEILESSPARHFLLGVKHLGMSAILLLLAIKNLPILSGLASNIDRTRRGV